MLKYFKNDLLLHWLDVRGYKKEYEAVKSINKELDNKSILVSLIKIFEITNVENKDIDKKIAIINYEYEEKKLIEDIERDKRSMSNLIAHIVKIEKEYFELFKLDYYRLFNILSKKAPKAIYALFTIDKLKKVLFNNEIILNKIKNNYCINYGVDEKGNTYNNNDNIKNILGNDLKIIKRNTQGMWDPIEDKGHQIMLIAIQNGTFVKNADNRQEKLSAEDVNFKFLKFDGLNYQCNDEDFEDLSKTISQCIDLLLSSLNDELEKKGIIMDKIKINNEIKKIENTIKNCKDFNKLAKNIATAKVNVNFFMLNRIYYGKFRRNIIEHTDGSYSGSDKYYYLYNIYLNNGVLKLYFISRNNCNFYIKSFGDIFKTDLYDKVYNMDKEIVTITDTNTIKTHLNTITTALSNLNSYQLNEYLL